MPYSPFQKPISDLEAADLDVLKDVNEGWYVEYKREVSKAPDIAKSISAFANTYGGWLFYGIEEKSKSEPVAGSFPGVARAELDSALQRVRQAVATHVNPSPHFDTKLVWGPHDPIGLPADAL
jgi:predicted HTH transcriptional regulator